MWPPDGLVSTRGVLAAGGLCGPHEPAAHRPQHSALGIRAAPPLTVQQGSQGRGYRGGGARHLPTLGSHSDERAGQQVFNEHLLCTRCDPVWECRRGTLTALALPNHEREPGEGGTGPRARPGRAELQEPATGCRGRHPREREQHGASQQEGQRKQWGCGRQMRPGEGLGLFRGNGLAAQRAPGEALPPAAVQRATLTRPVRFTPSAPPSDPRLSSSGRLESWARPALRTSSTSAAVTLASPFYREEDTEVRRDSQPCLGRR